VALTDLVDEGAANQHQEITNFFPRGTGEVAGQAKIDKRVLDGGIVVGRDLMGSFSAIDNKSLSSLIRGLSADQKPEKYSQKPQLKSLDSTGSANY
jgi:hypothetical protein